MYHRFLKNSIKAKLFQGKAIIIVGARQTGKTTLANMLIEDLSLQGETISFNCDNPTDREILNNKDINLLSPYIGDKKFVFIDEGQKVPTIGQTLKLLVDYYKAKI